MPLGKSLICRGVSFSRRLDGGSSRRREAGCAHNVGHNATVLAVLTKMLRLAYENGKLLRRPTIRKLKEAAPRQGFFEREQYESLRRHLRPELQVATAVSYAFGWRTQSEVLTLELRQLDLKAETIPPGPRGDEE